MKELNIVLVNPNLFGDPNVPGSYRKARIPTISLGLGALASYVEKYSNHHVTVIDARIEGLDPAAAFKKMQTFDPDLVGVSLCSHESTTWTVPFLEMVRTWKKEVHITLGNHFASLFPEKALSQMPANSVVIGEGEETLLELIHCLAYQKNWNSVASLAWRKDNGQIILNQKRPFIADINTLPPPKRFLLENEGENCEMVIEGGRGCAFNCSFCTIGPFYGLQKGPMLRQKNAQTIFSEIKQICEQYPKLRRVRFVDPEFFVGKSGPMRIKELADLLKNNLPGLQICVESRASSIIRHAKLLDFLKMAGLVRINMGIESGSQKILNKMRKCTKVEDNILATQILRDLDVDYSYGFMMITPWCLDEDIELNALLLEKIGKIELHKFFHEMTLIPGTDAFQEVIQEKELSWKGNLHYFTYATNSKRIEKYRKIASIFEKQHHDFFTIASFLYESIRASILAGQKDLAKTIEKKSDQLFLEIFKFCWEAAESDLKESDYSELADKCYGLFVSRLKALLTILDPALSFPLPTALLPKHSIICQV
jgi:anaerobic magnesium-protoporphyrin IX monomethyl ester cyclase